MLIIKPIQDKLNQEDIAKLFRTEYREEDFAYFAADCDPDTQSIHYMIGFCQLSLHGDAAHIDTLKEAPCVSDEEAMILTARTAMNFMYRCGIKKVLFPKGSDCTDELVGKLGFSAVDGEMMLDLVEFYRSPCKFNKANEG